MHVNDLGTISGIINGLMDTPVSELSTLEELIFGIAISASMIAVMFGFPILSEKIADVICAITQKSGKMLVWHLANYLNRRNNNGI